MKVQAVFIAGHAHTHTHTHVLFFKWFVFTFSSDSLKNRKVERWILYGGVFGAVIWKMLKNCIRNFINMSSCLPLSVIVFSLISSFSSPCNSDLCSKHRQFCSLLTSSRVIRELVVCLLLTACGLFQWDDGVEGRAALKAFTWRMKALVNSQCSDFVSSA